MHPLDFSLSSERKSLGIFLSLVFSCKEPFWAMQLSAQKKEKFRTGKHVHIGKRFIPGLNGYYGLEDAINREEYALQQQRCYVEVGY